MTAKISGCNPAVLELQDGASERSTCLLGSSVLLGAPELGYQEQLMDVLHFIKSYHDEVMQAVEAVVAADGPMHRRRQVDVLAKLVQAYVELEKDYLYPEISDLFAGVDAIVRVGEANGATILRRVKNLLKMLDKSQDEQMDWEKRLAELREGLIEHFGSEEQILMPKMRLMIRTEDREDLGQVFMDARDELLRADNDAVTIGASSRKRA